MTIASNGKPTILRSLRVEELGDEDLDAIAATQPAPEAEQFADEDPQP